MTAALFVGLLVTVAFLIGFFDREFHPPDDWDPQSRRVRG